MTSKEVYHALCMLVHALRGELPITERSRVVETAEREVQPIHPWKSDHEAHRKYCDGSLAQRKRGPRQAHLVEVDHRGVGKLFARTGAVLDQVSSTCRASTRKRCLNTLASTQTSSTAARRSKQRATDSVVSTNTGLAPMHVGALMKDKGRRQGQQRRQRKQGQRQGEEQAPQSTWFGQASTVQRSTFEVDT